jgi:ribonuclease VapC
VSLVVDSSALIAILLGEDDREVYSRVLEADGALISAVNLYEARIVACPRLGEPGLALLDRLLAMYDIQVAPFDEHQADIAFRAYDRFGKGRHPARLNLADCAAYALAQSLGVPLLFKGEDFRRTDVKPAV